VSNGPKILHLQFGVTVVVVAPVVPMAAAALVLLHAVMIVQDVTAAAAEAALVPRRNATTGENELPEAGVHLGEMTGTGTGMIVTRNATARELLHLLKMGKGLIGAGIGLIPRRMIIE